MNIAQTVSEEFMSRFEKCAVTNYTDGKRTIKNRNQVTAAEFVNIFL